MYYSCMSLLHRRRNLIAQVLQAGGAATQEELVAALSREGVRVTQGTVSRDLAALGAVKTPAGYRLAGDLGGPVGDPTEQLGSALSRHAVSVRAAASIVVVGTAPGHAGVVADAVDAADLETVAGTIAGDDTIFIAATSLAAAAALAAELNALAAGTAAVS